MYLIYPVFFLMFYFCLNCEGIAAECDYSSFKTNAVRPYGSGNPGWRFNKKIVYSESVNDKKQVHLLDPDSGLVECLTCESLGNNDGPEWSPDGKIIFISDRDHEYSFGSAGGGMGQELYIMDADGGNQTRLTFSPPHATNYHVHFSNKGDKILWTATPNWTWDVMIADLVVDDTGAHLENSVQMSNDTVWYETHDFFKDDASILVTASRDGIMNGEIYLMEIENKEVQRLTDFSGWDEHAHFSPDGTKIALMSSRHQRAAIERFIIKDLPPFLDFLLVFPGTLMGFMNQPVGYSTELYLMNPDGTEIQRLTFDNEVVADNSWSPDGRQIAYSQNGQLNILTFSCSSL